MSAIQVLPARSKYSHFYTFQKKRAYHYLSFDAPIVGHQNSDLILDYKILKSASCKEFL